jgi:hypothetical protein
MHASLPRSLAVRLAGAIASIVTTVTMVTTAPVPPGDGNHSGQYYYENVDPDPAPDA